ncbi:MAG: RluA family pseudouridine synthase [Acidimicrobiales bacterium]
MIETVPAALAGERLDRVVAMLTGRSRAEAASLVAAGAVTIGGEAVLIGKHRLAEGDIVAVDVPEADVTLVAEPDVAVAVAYEDDDVIVVDKPAGLVVHPGAGHGRGTLVNGLLARYPELRGVGDPERPGVVHRLDRDTSGLLVVARTAPAHRELTRALAAREVTRTYLALVHGLPEADAGLVDAPVGRSSRAPTRMSVSARGREARTRYEVEARYPDSGVSLLRCTLETGRTHQIRVHLAAIGHPVVGDTTYGRDLGSMRSPRTFLHAAHLAFAHPVTGQAMTFDSALPADLEGLRATL